MHKGKCLYQILNLTALGRARLCSKDLAVQIVPNSPLKNPGRVPGLRSARFRSTNLPAEKRHTLSFHSSPFTELLTSYY